MNNYLSFYDYLENNGLIIPVWRHAIKLIASCIDNKYNKDDILKLFIIYFSLIVDGNLGISLDKDILKGKWNKKIDGQIVALQEQNKLNEDDLNIIRKESLDAIDNCLDKINEDYLSEIIGDNKLFYIDDGYLYASKYYKARHSISESLQRIFKVSFKGKTFNYRDYIREPEEGRKPFELSKGQERAVLEGLEKNLIVTGGPGTGKTTSILFILIALLEDDPKLNVYLGAPSGKASDRMKESIINNLGLISDKAKQENEEIIKIIQNLDKSTIHKLLGIDLENGGFKHNKNNQFNKDSIFIIDEASMIDVNIFASLLEAIPTGARLFIMGDKNQLPSVDCGAVFGDLLELNITKDNVVELDESKRFGEDTEIYALAAKVNDGKYDELPVNLSSWMDYKNFKIESENKKSCPVFYYYDGGDASKDGEMIKEIVRKWGEAFFKDLQDKSMNIDYLDDNRLEELYSTVEKAKILCANNGSLRGIQTINKYAIDLFINKKKSQGVAGFYPGEILMINKNNKELDLDNGDNGIVVTFCGDDTLYFMVKKKTKLIDKDEKKENKIFKKGDFVFYPIRMITRNEIDFAYAITIHKSQGSDYEHILVVLPSRACNPLLNRQIVYTAITRTKGFTYILSNQDRFEEGVKKKLERDTRIPDCI